MSASRLRAALPLLLSFLAVSALAAEAPRVLQFSPQGEQESVRQVTARFATDMVRLGDPRLVNPFVVQCVAKGKGRWVDSRNWAYDFGSAVPRGRSCSFTLPQGQKDLAGAALAGQRQFGFNTSPLAEAPAAASGGQVSLDFFTPQGEAHPVSQVQARFSEDMVRLGGGKLWNPFGVGCAVKGTGRWVDGRNWVYEFLDPLPSGIACQFVPTPGLRALSGRPLKAYGPQKFHTGSPRVIDERPGRGSEGIEESQIFLLHFDGDNDRVSLANNAWCQVEGIKEKIPLRFLTVEDTRAFVAKVPPHYQEWWGSRSRVKERRAASCARALPPGAKVQLVFARTLASTTGVTSGADQVLEYQVRPAFSASFACLRENARQACAPMTAMRLNFTDAVEEELLKAIRLEGDGREYSPTLDTGSDYDYDDESGFTTTVSFEGPFPPETNFVLRLPPGLTDLSGRPLANAARFPLAVRTAAYPPLAKFAAPFGLIEQAAGAVPLTVRNLEPGRGVTPDARLFTLRLPDDDRELLRWMGRFGQHQSEQNCYNCRGRDEATGVWDAPDPRTRSLLAKEPGMKAQVLPRQLGAKEFEVIGLPVKSGAYVHEVESRYLGEALTEPRGSMYVSALSVVTNLGVHLRTGSEESLVWVTSLDKAQPVANAEVTVWDCKGLRATWQGRSDAQGLVRFPTPKDFTDYDDHCMSRFAVIARANGDRGIVLPRWDDGIEGWRFNLSGWQQSGDYVAHAVLDRSLLRAGETLHMRHVVRRLSLRSLQAPRGARYGRLFIRHEGSGQEYDLPVGIGSDGNGENQWTIPRAAKLGQYAIELEIDGSTRPVGEFRVEEFRLPVLKAVLQLPAGAQVAPAMLPVDMQLQYLNGGAYPGAPVTLRGRLRRAHTTFPGFEDWSFSEISEEGGEGNNGQPLEEVALVLDEKGGLRASTGRLPAFDRISTVTVEMEYRDPSGETQSARAGTTVWPAAVLPGVRLPAWVSTAGKEPQRVDVVTLGSDGKPRANVAVAMRAEMHTYQSHRRRTVGGFYAYENVEKNAPLPLSCPARSDADGRLACRFTPTDSGELRVHATSRDEAGREMTSSASTWISSGERWWFEQGNDDRIDVLPEQKEYKVGDTLKLQVRMPFPEATALVGIERDGVMETHVQALSAANPVISLPVKAEYAPNVFVSVFLVRGRNAEVAPTALVDLGKPAFKLGIAEVKVGWDAVRLGVEVSSDKPRYQPREQAQVSVRVTPPAGQALPAGTEVTLAAVDEALLELADNPSWDLLTPMMQPRGHDVGTATSQLQVVGKRHYGRKALPAGGGGGRGASTRELFDTLIYWQARAAVDAEGRARFTVPLNDSLTGFRLVAVAASENRFGTGKSRMESFQELSVLSGLPLVVRQGDTLDPGFTVRNSSDRAHSVKLKVLLESGTAPARVLLEKTQQVAAGKSVIVPVPFTVPADVGSLKWTVSAEGQGVADRLAVTQKVIDPVPERVLQATLFQLEGSRDIPVERPHDALPGGALQVSGQARLADSLGTVKSWFANYPYACLEQKTSRAAGLQDRANWDEVMELLPVYLDERGLAAFYPGTTGYPFLTQHILRVSKALAWPVPEASRARMLDALTGWLEGRVAFEDWKLRDTDDVHRRLEVMSLLAHYGRFRNAQLDTIRIDPPRWSTATLLNWLELLRAAPSIPRRDERLAQAQSLLRSRLTLQGTVYALAEGEYSWWWLYENNESTLARLMLATMDLPGWREDQPRLLRSLVATQRAGRWSTTVSNLWGGFALKRFSETFERDPVHGRTVLALDAQQRQLDWSQPVAGPERLEWPAQTGTLRVAQEGSGKPWITVQSRARLPLKAPLSTGFTVEKTVDPLQQKVKGQWSVGDVVRVRLRLKASANMGWVVLDDPIPAGSTLLGRALGRDASLAQDEADAWTWATFAEFGADSYRAYYERIYQGEWEARYTLRLNQSGDFRLPPTRVEAMYAPEMFGMLPNANWVVKP